MSLVPPQDALFLLGESRENPAHVTALQIFRPPAGAGEEFLDELYGVLTDPSDVSPAFTRKPVRSWSTAGAWAWEPDDDLDLTAHVRRTALPPPGRMRDLLEHVSHLHARLLDRSRPLWEAELVSGLGDGRFALVTRVHRSMADATTLARHVLGGLSPGPGAHEGVAPWARTKRSDGRPPGSDAAGSVGEVLRDSAGTASRVVGGLPALAGAAARVATGGIGVAFQAPDTRLNRRLSGSRRFAGDAWDLRRMRAVAGSAHCSVHDVGLAMCSGALRAYLDDLGELPGTSLVALVPVPLRGTGTVGAGGAARGSVFCVLGTDLADAGDRLLRITTSMAEGTQALHGLDPVYAVALHLAARGLTAAPRPRVLPRPPRPVVNLVVSDVPSADETRYLRGAELTDDYPVSMVGDGQALTITTTRYRDRVGFGVTGCPKAVPHLQRLLGHLDTALGELEVSAGVV